MGARSASTAQRPALAGPQSQSASRGELMLAGLLLGQSMCIIDVLVVNVAMPGRGTGCSPGGRAMLRSPSI